MFLESLTTCGYPRRNRLRRNPSESVHRDRLLRYNCHLFRREPAQGLAGHPGCDRDDRQSAAQRRVRRCGGVGGGERRKLFTLGAVRSAGWSYNYQFWWSRGDMNARHDAGHLYRLPFAEGAAYTIGQSCDGGFSHRGLQRFAVDFDMPEGTAIHAARAGRVVDIKEDSRHCGSGAQYRQPRKLCHHRAFGQNTWPVFSPSSGRRGGAAGTIRATGPASGILRKYRPVDQSTSAFRRDQGRRRCRK